MDRQRKRREGEKRWGRNGGGERVRSIFRETERHGGCVSELAGEVWVCASVLGKGVCTPGRVRRAGALWEVAGRKQLERRSSSCRRGAALLSVSVSEPGIRGVRIPRPKFGCCSLRRAGRQYSLSAERCGPDWIPRFAASKTPAQPVTEGISLPGIVPIFNFAPRSQPAGCSRE